MTATDRRRRGAIAIAIAIATIGFLLLAVRLGATGTTPVPLGAHGHWRLVFDEEFNSLNTSVWSTSRQGDGTVDPGFSPGEQECFDPAEAIVTGGSARLALVAKPESCGGVHKRYAGAILTTVGRWSFTHGFLEARVWLPEPRGGVGDWPAVWAVGSNWPAGGELDVVEGSMGVACWHFHDPLGAPGACVSRVLAGAWHIFGADWEHGVVRWYYDGVEVGRVTHGVTNHPMSIILDLAADAGPVLAPALMRVDYVRVWQR